jgi:hypothetical protein
MRVLHSESQRVRSRTQRKTLTGTGRIGMLIRSSIASSSCSKRPHWRHTVNKCSRSSSVFFFFTVFRVSSMSWYPDPWGYNIRDRSTARLSRPATMFLEAWHELWPHLPIDRTKRWRDLVVHATKRQFSLLPPLLDSTYLYLFYFARMTTKRVYLLRHGQAEHKSVRFAPARIRLSDLDSFNLPSVADDYSSTDILFA